MSRIQASFDGKQSSTHLSELCLELLSEQKQAWPDLWQGRESLKHIRVREITCDGFSVRVQYNPGRIKSTLADVKEKDVLKRPCFLCLNNLPETQQGILYRREYLILCNPMPVFPCHFTISHVDHHSQAIANHVDTFLQLMGDFGSHWTILYNGPKCGASAPDHLHFQAIPSGQMPIEKEIQDDKKLLLMTQIDGVLFYRARNLGRQAIILEGDDPAALADALKGFLNVLKKTLHIDEEPMINIAGFQEERKRRLLILPRAKHRPDAFFREGDARVVVSPAVVEMGGVLVTPVEHDFDRLDADAVEGIYREVSLEAKIVESAIDMMR